MVNENREFIDPNELMRYINEKHSYAGLPMAAHICTMELLTYAPRVDAVEVVRCKDCKHFWHYKRTQMHIDGKSVPAGMCHLWSKIDSEHPVLPNDFCSHGKRGDNCIAKHPELLKNQ